MKSTDLPLHIGAYTDPPDDPAYGFGGCIDELCFYRGVLDEARIRVLAKR